MTVTTFAIAAYNLYVFPSSWTFSDYLRYAGGLSLIALQVWTSISVYDALGEFGWYIFSLSAGFMVIFSFLNTFPS